MLHINYNLYHVPLFIGFQDDSPMEAIFLLRNLMERYREACKDLHMVLIDVGKVYDKVPRETMWWVLEKKRKRKEFLLSTLS